MIIIIIILKIVIILVVVMFILAIVAVIVIVIVVVVVVLQYITFAENLVLQWIHIDIQSEYLLIESAMSCCFGCFATISAS